MRTAIRFLRRGRIVELSDVKPTDTVLDYLRLKERACGTKEGCAEGDCGACTVVVGSLGSGGRLQYRHVNSCILLLGQVDGREIIAVDDIALAEGRLHPVQQAMVKHHGSQCGFCTPGFVMSLFSLYHAGFKPSRSDVNDWLAGNLCRCTGYRPIVDAALDSCSGQPADSYATSGSKTVSMLKSLASDEDVFIGTDEGFLAIPASVESLAELYAKHPDAVLLSGATDVGLWITKQLKPLPKIICLNRAGLDTIEETTDTLIIGAATTYGDAESHLNALDPDLGELLRRLGSKQVRAVGTLGGNVANGSPIGDTPPALIVLGTTIELRRASETRSLPLEDFFLAYGKQDRRTGEFLMRMRIPKLKPNQAFRCYKISKRFDQDISAVMGAFRFDIEAGRIVGARIAYGGMAATPKRALKTEAAVRGLSLSDPSTWQRRADHLMDDFEPIGDHRASAPYRMATAKALLGKALREIASNSSEMTRLIGIREKALGRVA